MAAAPPGELKVAPTLRPGTLHPHHPALALRPGATLVWQRDGLPEGEDTEPPGDAARAARPRPRLLRLRSVGGRHAPSAHPPVRRPAMAGQGVPGGSWRRGRSPRLGA